MGYSGSGFTRRQLFSFSVLTTAIFFLGLEGGLRLLALLRPSRSAGHLPNPDQRSEFQVPDPLLAYALKPGYDAGGIHVNTLGFRGREISREKSPGTLRIVSIGDSTTFGLAGEDCPYPAQLEKQLGDLTRPNTPIEVVNAGVEGYGTRHLLRFVSNRLRDLHPDLVLVYVGWNDLYGSNPFDPAGSYDALSDAPASALQGLLYRSYVVRGMRRLLLLELPRFLARFKGSRPTAAPRVSAAATSVYERNLGRIVYAIRQAGARPVLMTLPSVLSENASARADATAHYPSWAVGKPQVLWEVWQAYNSAIRRVAANTGALLIDNASFFDALGARKESLFFDTLHMYCPGYGLLATNVREELLRQGAITAVYRER